MPPAKEQSVLIKKQKKVNCVNGSMNSCWQLTVSLPSVPKPREKLFLLLELLTETPLTQWH